MGKKFNINGVCYPDKHYMVNLDSRLKQVKAMVDEGDYFVINRARQYGKTTLLRALQNYLCPEYLTISMSFQKMSTAKFLDEFAFARAFANDFIQKGQQAAMGDEKSTAAIVKLRADCETIAPLDLTDLFEKLSSFCQSAGKRVVLMIDEVDQASNHQVFLDLLGQMREYYLNREEQATFYSVILAGVYDIKNLRLKIRPDEAHRYDSPWNVAVPFDVDMNFSPEDITTMLQEFEAEHQTGMDLKQIAEELYRYTGGYPYLVSCLCRQMDRGNQEWTQQNIRLAVRDLLKDGNTLFDDVIKNMRNHPSFANLVERVIVDGAEILFEIYHPDIQLGYMFGILKEVEGKVAVSNVIFETLIYNFLISMHTVSALTDSDYRIKTHYIENGKLNMKKVIDRFSDFMTSEYRKEDGSFLEHQGKLLFLSFLRPIINGVGHYVVEPQTRQNRRMDILVFYGAEEYVIELKMWRGEVYEQKGYEQLADYLDAKNLKEGYLISFCTSSAKNRESNTIQYRNHELYEAIVKC